MGADCEEVMDAYCDRGGNLIDSADVYPLDSNPSHCGLAEELIGEWLFKRKNRSRIVIATKVGGATGEGASDKGLGGKHILKAVDDSLKRLKTDYIDIYQTHWDDGTDPEETLRALDDLVKAGKVRYIGCCSYSASRLVECFETSRRRGVPAFRTLQLKINLIDRDRLAREIETICANYDLAILAYSPLAGGFLTGKYLDEARWPISARSAMVKSRYWKAENIELVRRIAAVCKRMGISVIEFCIIWTLGQHGVKVALFGANSISQLQKITASVRSLGSFQAEVTRVMEEVFKELAVYRKQVGSCDLSLDLY